MEENFVKRLREQERILGEMHDNMQGWMDDLLNDAFNPDNFLRYVADMGIDFSKMPGMTDQPDEADGYQVLGLEKTATDEEVKKRYREMIFKFHPDTAEVPGTGYLCQKITTAYFQIARERGW